MSCWAIISILRWFFGGGWLMVLKNEYCMLPPSCYTPLLFFCDCFVNYIMSNCFWEEYTPQSKDSGMNQTRIFYASCNLRFVSASDQTTGSSPKSWFSREIPSTCFSSVPKKLLAKKKTTCETTKIELLGGGFQDDLFLHPTWIIDPIWLLFFKWVETTN